MQIHLAAVAKFMPQALPMKSLLNRVISNWNIAAGLLGMWAWGIYLGAVKVQQTSLWILFAGMVIVALGLVLRQGWARVTALGILGLMALLKLSSLVTKGFTLNQLLYAIGIGVVAYYLWKEPDKGIIDDFSGGLESDNSEPPKPMISLVHLRASQRYLEPVVLANALSEAWGAHIFAGDGDPPDDADGFVAGDGPLYMVMRTKPSFAMFIVHNHDRNYFDEPEDVAKSVPNLRFAQIIREHSAWLAVDLMQVSDNSLDQDEAYRMIGKAVSALADDDVMAILCPQYHFFNLWSPELEKMLCGDSPLDALREEVKAPVFGVPDGDAIENAIAEARRRWPEFAAAFKNREPGDDRFIVKAPFVGDDGQTEHMWLQVFGLEPEYVHGHLANDPMHTTKLKKGSQVEVPVAEISDWLCPDTEGNALGNFTHEAVKAAAKPTAET